MSSSDPPDPSALAAFEHRPGGGQENPVGVPISPGLAHIAERWPWLAAAMVIGSLAGLLFSSAFSPRFQATAAIAVGIDYGRTQPLELIVEDRVLDRVYQLITSDATIMATVDRLSAAKAIQQPWQDLQGFQRKLRLDQRLSRWELIAFDEDPELAATIANAWAAVALEKMMEAQDHAWRASKLQGIDSLVRCIGLLPPSTLEDTLWLCVGSSPGLSSGDVDELRAEIDASHGVLPNMSFELIEHAVAPEEPVVWNRGALVLAGGLAGLVAGIVLVVSVRTLRGRSA